MPKCASCKNKSSTDQCPNTSLPGVIFCGKHLKAKEPRLWRYVNQADGKATIISKIWKGYDIRKRLKLSGSAVLKRSICHNEEELMTLESINTVNPLDFFSFEDGGKIYGFDVRTILESLHKSTQPINPYTRQPIPMEARLRLRQLYGYRLRNKLPDRHDIVKFTNVDEFLTNRWLQVCQIAEEHYFFGVQPNIFMSLNRTQLFIFLSMIFNDVRTWASEHKELPSRRFRYAFWLQNIINKFSTTQDPDEYSFYVSTVILSILYDCPEPYTFCFIVMSSLYRL